MISAKPRSRKEGKPGAPSWRRMRSWTGWAGDVTEMVAFGDGLRRGKGVHQTGPWVKNISVSVTSRAGTLTRPHALHSQGKKQPVGQGAKWARYKRRYGQRHGVQDHRDPAERGRTSGYSEGKCARQSSDTTLSMFSKDQNGYRVDNRSERVNSRSARPTGPTTVIKEIRSTAANECHGHRRGRNGWIPNILWTQLIISLPMGVLIPMYY